MTEIRRLEGLQILDSRGHPTVQATCELASGAMGTASVPSGASTGRAEAHELRDGDPNYFNGLGCRMAVGNIGDLLQRTLAGRTFNEQHELDQAMITLDGTLNKERIGANAMLAVSAAFARASSVERGLPLYRYLSEMCSHHPVSLARPTINLFSGGKHAGGQVSIQDVLVVPASANTVDEALATTFRIYQSAAELTYQKYGMRALAADEGGLAPPFPNSRVMIEDALASIRSAGFEPGRDVFLAVDFASTHFFRDGCYHLDGESLTSSGMIERIVDWLDRYPILSVEDGLAEEDWSAWSHLTAQIGGRSLVLADDLLCTNPTRIKRAIESRACDALLLKVNQIGTFTEAAKAYQMARSAGWHVTVSARSGETEDNWLADLAVGWGCDQIKIGSITRSERLAKYNRLLAIEAATKLPLAG